MSATLLTSTHASRPASPPVGGDRLIDRRYHSLDLWRGIACLMIVIFHSSLYILENPGKPVFDAFSAKAFHAILFMWIGVPIFFVVSGYCIAAACDSLRSRERKARQYFTRRFRRIFPPYWTALALFTLLGLLLVATGGAWVFGDALHPIPTPGSITAWRWIGTATLTETWRFTLSRAPGSALDSFLLGTAWTLCYEEQFYAVCGLAMILAPRRFFSVLAAITVAVVGIVVLQPRLHWPIAGFFFDGRWLTFAAGVLVYYRLKCAPPAARVWLDLLLVGAFAVSVFTGHTQRFADPATSRALEELSWGCAFAILLLGLNRWDKSISQNRLLLPISSVGVMCYSLYLIHWPLVKVVSHLLYVNGLQSPLATLLITVPLCLVLALVVSIAFHRIVERRFMATPSKKLTPPGKRDVPPVAPERTSACPLQAGV